MNCLSIQQFIEVLVGNPESFVAERAHVRECAGCTARLEQVQEELGRVERAMSRFDCDHAHQRRRLLAALANITNDQELQQTAVPDRPPDPEVLTPLGTRQADTARPVSIPSHSKRWYLMRVMVPTAAAASVFLGVLGWLALTSSNSVAMADVIKAAEKHKLVRYQLKQITDDKLRTAEGKFVVYVDLKSPRLRQEHRTLTLNDVLDAVSVMVQDNQQDRFLNMLSQKLIVTEKEAKDEIQAMTIKMVREQGIEKKEAHLFDRLDRQGDVKPFSDLKKNKMFFDHLRALQSHKDTTSTKLKLNGREVMKYLLEEGDKTSALWVDAKTKLPIRIEYEMIDPTPNIARNKWIYTDFEWDPEVKDVEQLFSTKPPEGFTVKDHTNDK